MLQDGPAGVSVLFESTTSVKEVLADLVLWQQLGIFLCMRCASLHRKLGTHISKVKSLSMDSWSNEQVDVRLMVTIRSNG